MRYTVDDKLEIILLVGNLHLGFKRTLDKLGVARPTPYRRYPGFRLRGGRPEYTWDRLPKTIRGQAHDIGTG